MQETPDNPNLVLIAQYAPVACMIITAAGEVTAANPASLALWPEMPHIGGIGLSEADLCRMRMIGQGEIRKVPVHDDSRYMQLDLVELPGRGLLLLTLTDIDNFQRRIESLCEQVETDALTEVASRRRLFDEGRRMLAEFKRHGIDLAVAVVDLDNFKVINDKCGHVIGDHVLAFVAEIMRNSLRRSDVIGRIGGDEFAILMPHAKAQAAKRTLERLMLDVARELQASPPARILPTISAGVAEAGPADESFETILDRADRAMYAGKRQGPGSVVLDS